MNDVLKELSILVPPPMPPLKITSTRESITGMGLELPADYLECMELLLAVFKGGIDPDQEVICEIDSDWPVRFERYVD